MKTYKAKYLGEIEVTDPDSKGTVTLEVYKHPNGGIFAIDASYLEQEFDDDVNPSIPDPFSQNDKDIDIVKLASTNELEN